MWNYGGGIFVNVDTNIICHRTSQYECEYYDTIAVKLHIESDKTYGYIIIYSSFNCKHSHRQNWFKGS